MPHFRFAYPVRLDERGCTRVFVSCRDLPELSLEASGVMASIFDAVEAAIDEIVERRLAAMRCLCRPPGSRAKS